MFRFIHVSDFHLDNGFKTKNSALKALLIRNQHHVFNHIIDICIEKKIHGLLIAGDLFETPVVSFKTEQLIMNGFNKLKEVGIHVYYAIGNHDAGLMNQKRKLNWPSNVTIFAKDEVETYTISNNETQKICKVSGIGHTTAQESRNLVPLFPRSKENEIHVGLLHTMVTNASSIDNDCFYLPCTMEELEQKEYNYWALGHIHKRQQVGNTSIYYAGNPQGLKSKETGPKGVYYINISEFGDTQVDFIETSLSQWVRTDVDISSCKSLDQLLTVLNKRIKQVLLSYNQCSVIPVVNLSGRSELKSILKKDTYLTDLREALILELGLSEVLIKTDTLEFNYPLESILSGDHLLKETLDLIENLSKEYDVLNRLSDIDLAHNSIITKDDKHAYIIDLVKDMKSDIIELFLEDHHEN